MSCLDGRYRRVSLLPETADFQTLNLIGCEGVVSGREDHINQLEGDLWEQWVDFNYRFGQEPLLYGAADRLLYVGRKKQNIEREICQLA